MLSASTSPLGQITRPNLVQLQRELGQATSYRAYAADPVGFIRDILDERPWSIQARIAEAVRDNPQVAVPSCFGSGKDWIAARLVAWWTATGGISVTTADTYRQVRDILWRELRRAHGRGQLPGIMRTVESRWEIDTGTFAIGIKPEDSNPEGLQGIHGRRVMVVIDEANGVGPDLWEASKGLVVTPDSRLLAIGNPHEPVGPFYEACRSAAWHIIHISVFDTPNFTGEPVPQKAQDELVSPFWLDQRRAEGLEDTPWWTAKVLGEFPDTASNSVIPLSWVETARTRPHVGGPSPFGGLDVARFGTDDSVLITGSGNGPDDIVIVHGHDTMQVAGMAAHWMRSNSDHVLAIDVVGVGGGVYDRLREQGYHVRPVNAGEAAEREPDRMLNLRAELWWAVRDALREGELSFAALPEQAYTRLRAELTGPLYRLTSAGKVQIESKEEMRARGIGSPDLADALCLWYWARSRARRRAIFAGAA